MMYSEPARPCSAADGDVSTITPGSSPTVWTLRRVQRRPIWARPTGLEGPAARPIRQTDHACLRSISPASTSPLRRRRRRRSIPEMTSSRIPTAGASPSHRGRRGRACWKWLTWEIGAGIWRIPAGQAATSTWFRSGRCSVLLTRQMPIRSSTAHLNDPITGNGYGDLNQATNNLYANYNAAANHMGPPRRPILIQANYTLQKALGHCHR